MQLTKLLKRRYIRQTNEAGAILIQRRWKQYWANKLYLKREETRETAARLIQSHWRTYRAEVLIPRKIWKQKMKSVMVLQRYIRGYM